MKTNHFQQLLSSYFLKYIPERTSYSSNTIKSYRDTFILLFQYQEHLHKSLTKISLETMNCKYIEDFLVWLECEKHYSTTSINQRLAAVHAFYKYVLKENPEYIELCTSVLRIKSKKVPIVPMNYFSAEALKLLLSLPDSSNEKGRRELAILTLLYDSGARVQEIADLTFGDIRIIKPATVRLTGKGNKTRIVPIMPQTLAIISVYMDDCKRKTVVPNTHPLFFNKRGEKLTRAGIAYILEKYVNCARNARQDLFPDKVSPHTMRHSKSMHLLEGGVNLIYIRDFLGHTSVVTTERYAKSNPEVKRKAIESASPNVLPSEKYSDSQKEELMEWLKSFI
ncbi:MAG: site-specific integrase [Tissierellia bacterium]|jgi:site-specific recombinase XerD|nr:site-specific integrase [Tissierellia bacterium]